MWSFRLEKGSDRFMEVVLIQPPPYCSQAYLDDQIIEVQLALLPKPYNIDSKH